MVQIKLGDELAISVGTVEYRLYSYQRQDSHFKVYTARALFESTERVLYSGDSWRAALAAITKQIGDEE